MTLLFVSCTDCKLNVIVIVIVVVMPRSFLITNRRYRTPSSHDADASDDVGDDLSCSPSSSSSSWSPDEGSQGIEQKPLKFVSPVSICFESQHAGMSQVYHRRQIISRMTQNKMLSYRDADRAGDPCEHRAISPEFVLAQPPTLPWILYTLFRICCRPVSSC